MDTMMVVVVLIFLLGLSIITRELDSVIFDFQMWRRLWKLVLDQLVHLLIRRDHVHPLVFFLQMGYITLVGTFSFSLVALVAAILFTLIHRVNYFWYVGILLQPNLYYLSIPNLLFGLVSCNERWKLLLYLYVVIFFCTYSVPNLNAVYNIIALTGIGLETYCKLPFLVLNDNRYYFMGFIGLLMHFTLHFFVNITGSKWDDIIYSEVVLVAIVLFAASSLISRRIESLNNSTFEEIPSLGMVYHYISMIKIKSREPLERVGIEKMHKFKCNDPVCFCRTPNQIPFEKLYVRKLSKMALKKFDTFQFREPLQEMYVEQMLTEGMFPLAVETFLKQNNFKWDIFKEVIIRRIKANMEQKLKFIEASYQWKTCFDDPFEYEKNFQNLRRFIMELIALKIEFWHEIIKKSTKAVKLKSLGKQFLDKLNKMNRFYLREIAEVEKEIKVYSGGILYNLFLLIATNYKEMAETNIKALKKSNDPTERKTYKLGIIKVSLTDDRMSLIENINPTLIRMLGSNHQKFEFIGKSMDFIVPDVYLPQHMAGMRRSKQLKTSNLIGHELGETLVVGANQTIICCSIFWKFSSNINNQLSIISFFKHYKNDCDYILLDGEGVARYVSDTKLDVDICQTRELQSVINEFKSRWKHVGEENPVYPVPDPIKIQMKYKESNYVCVVSSPLCFTFKYPQKPPLHLAINNQTQIYFHDYDIGQQADLGALKKIQVILDQNQTESQTSSVSRRSEIIEVLRMFQSNNGTKMFSCYYVIMGLIFLALIGFVTIVYVFTYISWLDPRDDTSNIIKLYNSHYELQYWMGAFINKGMSLYGIYIGSISNANYSATYGTANYSSSTLVEIKGMCVNMADLLYFKDNQNSGAEEGYYSAMDHIISIPTPSGNIEFKFNSLINLAVSNCYLMSTGVNFWSLIICDIYWQYVYPYYFSIFKQLQDSIYGSLNYYSKVNTVLFALLTGLILLILVPIYFGNRKVDRQEDYIFDLMTSIAPQLIQQDILDLADLEINLKSNYSVSFNFEEKENMVMTEHPGSHVEEDRSDLRTGTLDTKRRRTGELDTKGNNNQRLVLYLAVVIFIGFLLTLFMVKYYYIEGVKDSFGQISTLKKWRNQRLDMLINLKKWIYNLKPQELIQNKTISDWLQHSIENSRSNYPFIDNIDLFQVNCSVASAVCKNGTVSELSVNVFLLQLLTETYVSKTPDYFSTIAVLKDISKDVNDRKTATLMTNINNMTLSSNSLITLVYSVAWASAIIITILTMMYLSRVKREYVYLTRFITFLTEEMIKKNKRVESYLQGLMKSG